MNISVVSSLTVLCQDCIHRLAVFQHKGLQLPREYTSHKVKLLSVLLNVLFKLLSIFDDINTTTTYQNHISILCWCATFCFKFCKIMCKVKFTLKLQPAWLRVWISLYTLFYRTWNRIWLISIKLIHGFLLYTELTIRT